MTDTTDYPYFSAEKDEADLWLQENDPRYSQYQGAKHRDIPVDEFYDSTLSGQVESVEEQLFATSEGSVEAEMMALAYESLSEKDQMVLDAYHHTSITFEELAKVLGRRSKSTAHDTLRRSEERLKQAFLKFMEGGEYADAA